MVQFYIQQNDIFVTKKVFIFYFIQEKIVGAVAQIRPKTGGEIH